MLSLRVKRAFDSKISTEVLYRKFKGKRLDRSVRKRLQRSMQRLDLVSVRIQNTHAEFRLAARALSAVENVNFGMHNIVFIVCQPLML